MGAQLNAQPGPAYSLAGRASSASFVFSACRPLGRRRTARGPAACDPSQKGCIAERPHRHSATTWRPTGMGVPSHS
jgi:hypothetical protein